MITIIYIPNEMSPNVHLSVKSDLLEQVIVALIKAGCMILEVQ